MNCLNKNFVKCLLCISLLYVVSAALFAEVKLDFLFQDNYVFCAAKPASITGKADPGEDITVTFLRKSYHTVTDEHGRFCVKLPVLGVIKTPFTVTVQGKNTVKMENVVSGIVLLAGGQSNMEVPIAEALNPKEEIAAADYPLIREFKVEHDFQFEPVDSLKGEWTVVTPKTAPKIGAAAFYCARMLQKELDGIPVGIINNSYSGSPQHAWIPLASVQKLAPGRMGDYNKYKHLGHDGLIAYREKLGKEIELADSQVNKGEMNGWHLPDFDDSGWKTIQLPNMLETVYGEKDGSFWFRRTLDIPEKFAGKDLELELGVVDDYDITYFNGEIIGKTGQETVDPWNVKRYYRIPGTLVKVGKNTLVVRCFDSGHAGGLFDKPMTIKCDKELVADLTGPWMTNAEQILEPKKWPPDFLPLVKCYHFASVLYNAMFAPLRGTRVDAILWYQGETNAGSNDFEAMFRECIRVWRADLGDTDNHLPFLFVQLAAYTAPGTDFNKCGDWPKTRNDQAKVLDIPHTYMVTAIDIGDAKRIHPLNKQEIGRRFALYLLQDEFKQPGFANVIHYPVVEKAVYDAKMNQVVLTLKNPEKLHLTDGTEPRSFAISEPAQKVKYSMVSNFQPAKAVIKGDTIFVTVPKSMKNPATIRYGWMMNPEVNVANDLGFPLLPFELPIGK